MTTPLDPSSLLLENSSLRVRREGLLAELASLRARCEIAERECAQIREFAAKVVLENEALSARLVILRGAMDGVL